MPWVEQVLVRYLIVVRYLDPPGGVACTYFILYLIMLILLIELFMLIELIELCLTWLSYLSISLCLRIMSWLSYRGLAPILSSGALESQCRSGLLLSYPAISNFTSIIPILISTSTTTTT